jgi:uroporphyrinogen-III synthase
MTPKPVIAIMRPESYLPTSVEMAESLGFETITAPMIELKDLRDAMFETVTGHILSGKSDYVIFTSANGIEYTLSKLGQQERKDLITALNNTNAIAIGPNTRKKLGEYAIEVAGMPGDYSSEGLVEYLCPEAKGKTIDIARSAYGSEFLVSGLKGCGALVYETRVYTLVRPEGEKQAALMKAILERNVSVFAFTSSMMVRNFFSLADSLGKTAEVREILNASVVSAIGKPTAATLEEYGIQTTVLPGKYTFGDMLAAIKNELSL